MTILVDTNIFLEILLHRKNEEQCKEYLNKNIDNLYVSDFTLHSVGLFLIRENKSDIFLKFCTDILPKVTILTLSRSGYIEIPSFTSRYSLDFDDAYQAAIAREFSIMVLTRDKDFKKVKHIIGVVFI